MGLTLSLKMKQTHLSHHLYPGISRTKKKGGGGVYNFDERIMEYIIFHSILSEVLLRNFFRFNVGNL